VKKLGKKTYKRTRFLTEKRKVWELIIGTSTKEIFFFDTFLYPFIFDNVFLNCIGFLKC
jgi:hypothetical protein